MNSTPTGPPTNGLGGRSCPPSRMASSQRLVISLTPGARDGRDPPRHGTFVLVGPGVDIALRCPVGRRRGTSADRSVWLLFGAGHFRGGAPGIPYGRVEVVLFWDQRPGGRRWQVLVSYWVCGQSYYVVGVSTSLAGLVPSAWGKACPLTTHNIHTCMPRRRQFSKDSSPVEEIASQTIPGVL